ncbi:MAG TPA: RNA methyltransferase [Candidatus Solibacter sp.]|nr:RNA methyltransferase [Candidatus Solibacter sp.]
MHETHSIVHSTDPRYQLLRTLQTPRARDRTGRFIIEGIRHLSRATDERAPIESLFLCREALTNSFGQKLARRLHDSGIPLLQLAPHLYRELTLANDPQGIGAIVRQQWIPLCDVRPGTRRLWLAVESIDSPGNLGTIIRTAEATGVAGIILLGNGADPHDPATVRASMGAIFSQRFVRCETHDFIDWARARNVALVGSSPAGLLDYRTFPCRWPAVLLIGSEKRGLSENLQQACDFVVRIPMLGRGDSINAAVAAGVLLYELFHQRIPNAGAPAASNS